MKHAGRLCGMVMGWLLAGVAVAVERFPPPDFESGHTLPATTTPLPRAGWWEAVDVAVLAVALGIAAWLTLRRRSRRGIVMLAIGGLLYFGFFRAGCICAIGSIQNVGLALFEATYGLPLIVLAFFLLPLIVALFFGRAFCAGVCPHGALQDLVLIKPVALPLWLERGLRVIPYIYLGAAVLLAITGSAFIICRYDPFIGIFRLSGSRAMIVFGVVTLLLATVVGRPYCRFLCPYGALLSLLSRFSRWRVTVTPTVCTQCRLCADACPFGAIRTPDEVASTEPRPLGRRRLALLLAAVPVLVVGLGWGGAALAEKLSGLHPRVSLATEVQQAESGLAKELTDAVDGFRRQGGNPAALMAEATAKRAEIRLGGGLFGGFVGLVIGLSLLAWSVRRWRPDYEADRAHCVGCGRCFAYCPYELQRRGIPVENPPPAPREATR